MSLDFQRNWCFCPLNLGTLFRPRARHFTLKCFTWLKWKWVPGRTEMAMCTISAMRRNGCKTGCSSLSWNDTRITRSSDQGGGGGGVKCNVGRYVFRFDIRLKTCTFTSTFILLLSMSILILLCTLCCIVLSEAADECICFTRKIQYGGDCERFRPQGPKNVHNFLLTVRPLSWACGHRTEMLLILKKLFWTWLLPDIFRYVSPKKCLKILYAVNLWLKPVPATEANVLSEK